MSDPLSGIETEVDDLNRLAQIGSNTLKIQSWLRNLRDKAVEQNDSKGLLQVQTILSHFDAVITGNHVGLP